MKLPNGVTSIVGRQILQLKKSSPTIMFGAGVAIAITATVFACKATLQLEEVLDDHEQAKLRAEKALDLNDERYGEHEHTVELMGLRVTAVRKVVVLYAPAIGLGLVAVGLLTGAHATLSKRNAGLIAAYNVLDKGFKSYRDRVREELGEEKDSEFFFGTAEKEVVEQGKNGHEVKRVTRVAGKQSVYARVFDEYNQCWSRSALDNRVFLQAQQNYMNDLLQSRGHVFLNDVYDVLRMERSQSGSVVGWIKGHGDNCIDFGLFTSTDPIIREFMNLEHNDGIMIDFNVDGVVYDMLGQKF